MNDALRGKRSQRRIEAGGTTLMMGSIKKLFRQAVGLHDTCEQEQRADPGQVTCPYDVELDSKGLFIVGSARSGTSILSRCLNSSPDVYLMDESNLHVNWRYEDFPGFLGNMHRSFGNIPYKGNCLPDCPNPVSNAMEYCSWFASRFRYFGEKLAFGPHYDAGYLQDLFFSFNLKFFFQSTYILTIRSPYQTCESMRKLFPDRSVPKLIDAWARTARLLIHVYTCFPNRRYWLFHEEQTMERILELARCLGISLCLPEAAFDRRRQNHYQRKIEPSTELDECDAIYRELRDAFCPDTFQLSRPGDPMSFFLGVDRRLDAVLKATENQMGNRDLTQRAA